MIHRNIKPSSLLINHRGDVKISDFKYVKILTNSVYAISDLSGTLEYMSPSRITGGMYSYECDIWSLGITMYTCATGSNPYVSGKEYWNIVNKIKEDPVPTLSDKFSSYFKDFLSLVL